MDGREMYDEVNALLGTISKALDIAPEEAARAIEAGALCMEMLADEQGQHYLALGLGEKQVRIYQGAIKYAPETKGSAAPDEATGCGKAGCGCHE